MATYQLRDPGCKEGLHLRDCCIWLRAGERSGCWHLHLLPCQGAAAGRVLRAEPHLVLADVLPELLALDAVAPVEELGRQAALLLQLGDDAVVYPVKNPRHACMHAQNIKLQEETVPKNAGLECMVY